MKKSNKVSLFYVLTSIALFLSLIVGGVYGLYVSVGLNFARSSVPNVAGGGGDFGGVSNVSIAGTVNYTPSMTGIILLSIFLVFLSVIDLIIMIRQIVFFKQFKVVRNSSITDKIEKKTKSKALVLFWTFFLDIVCIIAGVAGIFINNRSFAGRSNFSWVFYAVDIAVALLALLSIILLIIKLKTKKNLESRDASVSDNERKSKKEVEVLDSIETKDINQMEYKLLKLDAMKKSGLISSEEYNKIRKKIINIKQTRIEKSRPTKI